MPGRDLIERVRKALGDRYTVLAAVGRGGNASIFAGRDPTGAQVPIKVLHPELAVSVAADRFLREIRYASQLNHPHIARMMDSGEADYLLWYVMPYLPGETVRQALRRESRLSISSAVTIAAEVLDALEHAHAHGIAHRDIKPDNILLAPPPQGAVLVDLGIAGAREIARRAVAARRGDAGGAAAVHRGGGVRTRVSIVAVVLALVVGLPTLASGQCPDGSPPPCGRRVALDTARYAILPFAHREGGQQSTLDGADCAELLTEGFARWIEVRLADKTRVYDALARHGARAPFRIPFDTAVAIARRLGAGKLVMGQLWSFGDTLRLTAGLYDVARGGTPVREITTRVAATGAIGAAFNALADSLLGAGPGAARGAGAEQTRSRGPCAPTRSANGPFGGGTWAAPLASFGRPSPPIPRSLARTWDWVRRCCGRGIPPRTRCAIVPLSPVARRTWSRGSGMPMAPSCSRNRPCSSSAGRMPAGSIVISWPPTRPRSPPGSDSRSAMPGTES